ncbi:unnamed protein product, partial [Musa textilis]
LTPSLFSSLLLSAQSMAAAGSGSFQNGRLASKRLMMLVALLVVSCCLGHGFGDEDHVEVEGIGGSCMESERRALLAVKSDMYDPGNRFSSWTGKDCCGWRGVACDNTTGHVTKLDLRYPCTKTFMRPIPYLYQYDTWHVFLTNETIGVSKVNLSLQELKHLKYLDLSRNNFALAPVPKMIAALVHLEYLDLSKAMFDGLIPPQFGNLSKLHHLDLGGWYDNRLQVDDLDWLSRIPSLKYLDMSSVDLSKETNWLHVINSLPTLEELYLDNAKLPYVPSPWPPFNLTAVATLALSANFNITSAMLRWLSNATSLEYVYLSSSGSPTIESVQVAVASLSNLKGLDLSYNSLEGEILELLNNVSSRGLKQLVLRGNYLSGDMPETLQSLRDLEYLDLSGNSNVSVRMPTWLRNLTSLRYLNLQGNKLIGGEIPPIVGDFVQLEHLDLSFTDITGEIPSSIGNLTNLEFLDISYNNIVGNIPETFGRLYSLGHLDMSYNNLSGQIPRTMDGLCNLTILILTHNNMGGELTSLLDSLSTCSQGASLSLLWLSGNNLSGIIPPSMSQLSQLQDLDLSSNSLEGNITEAHFSNLTSLLGLRIASNSLNVMLPNDWRPPFSAVLIDMSFCHIGAKFPDWIQTQQQLHYLYLSGVGLSGDLPVWFLNFSKGLRELNLCSNNLMGPLPSAPQLLLDLSNNSFGGPIPLSFEEATRLTVLSLSHNHINGNFSPFFCNMDSLAILDLSNNHLIGEVPDCHNSFSTSLQSLHLNNNNLSGRIPSFLKDCYQLIILDLGENKLFDKIPTWIGRNHSSLEVLRLRSNLLYGVIPENIVNLSSLQILDLSSNNLFGSLPTSLGNFTAMVEVQNDTNPKEVFSYIENILLTIKGSMVEYTTILWLVTSIDLSNNHLSGEIPRELTKLLGLRFLNLSNNQLTGIIPENIGDMNLLESLDLSVNSLSGEMPSSFSAMHFLERLNLSYNNLSGKIPTSGQLSTFESWTYVGNKNLCGTPLPACPVYQTLLDARVKDDEKLEKLLEYASVVVGFVVGFWLFIGTLIMKQAIRFTFFRWIDKTSDWVYVQFAVKLAKLKSK